MEIHVDPCPSLAVAKRLCQVMSVRAASWTPEAYPQLVGAPVVSVEHATALVHDAFNDRRLQRDVTALADDLSEAQLWDLYFQAYDKITFFSDGYAALVELTHRALPERGLLGDLGAGTGNFSSVLLSRAPEREVSALDISSVGLEAARHKALVLGVERRLHTHQRSLLELSDVLEARAGALAGAVLNNVLYRVRAAERIGLLRDICARLPRGGRLVLSDPAREVQRSRAHAEHFLASIARDAVTNGSPMTDFDLALVATINRVQLLESSPTTSDSEELHTVARAAGFEVLAGPERTYYEGCTTLVLERRAT